MPFSKHAHEVALAKVAAADRQERIHAVDTGFAMACQAIGLTEPQTRKLAGIAVARVEDARAKLAAAAK
jgi:hypothetical protein